MRSRTNRPSRKKLEDPVLFAVRVEKRDKIRIKTEASSRGLSMQDFFNNLLNEWEKAKTGQKSVFSDLARRGMKPMPDPKPPLPKELRNLRMKRTP